MATLSTEEKFLKSYQLLVFTCKAIIDDFKIDPKVSLLPKDRVNIDTFYGSDIEDWTLSK